MSYYDYFASIQIGAGRETKGDPPFAALVMAAMRKADSDNLDRLKAAFPDIAAEFYARFHAPGGMLGDEARGRTRHRAKYNTCACSEVNVDCPSRPFHCPTCSCDECWGGGEKLGYGG